MRVRNKAGCRRRCGSKARRLGFPETKRPHRNMAGEYSGGREVCEIQSSALEHWRRLGIGAATSTSLNRHRNFPPVWHQGLSSLRTHSLAQLRSRSSTTCVDSSELHKGNCRARRSGGGLRAWGCMQAEEGVPLQATRSARQRHLRFEDSAEVLRGGRSDFGAGGGSARSKCHQHIVTSPPTLREQLLAGKSNTIEVDDDQKNENLQIPKRRNLRA